MLLVLLEKLLLLVVVVELLLVLLLLVVEMLLVVEVLLMLLVRVVHCDSVGDCCGECPAGITGIAGIWREATVCRVCSAVCIYAWRYAVWVGYGYG